MPAIVKGSFKPRANTDLLAVARELGPLIADHADAAERDRRVPKAVI